MLSRTSKLREWVLFALVATLPAIATGVLGFRALRNEEAAVRREMLLQVDSATKLAADRFHETVDALTAGAPIGDVPFADPLHVAADELQPKRQSERGSNNARHCRELADRLRKGEGDARARIIADCREARTARGRMLWLLVALDAAAGVPAVEIAGWLDGLGALLGATERAAARIEIERASWLGAAERDQLAEKLGEPNDGQAARAHLAARRVAMRAGRAVISWRERSSIGLLRRNEDGGYEGFVVHVGSLRRALNSGWPSLPPDMDALLAPANIEKSGAAPTMMPAISQTASLLPGGVQLMVAYRDPSGVARRSKLVLVATALAASLLAVALAAVLFARMRRERRLGALRTDFVAAVSHELRTPIASIRMLSELLAEARVDVSEHDEMHRALAREAKRLGGTVDRLLGFSRMEAGKQEVQRTSVVVAEVVGNAVDTFEERHPDAAPVVRDLDAELRADLDVDAIAMALDNLLRNALKYAPDGKPYRVSVNADGDGIRISVADRGPGIAKRHQKRIFRPFERADDRLSKATEGSGIGLSLVRHVARAHGGHVKVESEPGRGATFSMWITRT